MDRDQISNPQLFHCPTCGASLPIPDAPSIRCEYCGSNVLVPPEYLPRKEADHDHPVSPVIVQLSSPGGNAEPSRRGKASLILILIVVFVSICVFSSVIMSATGVFTSAAIFGEAVKDLSPTEIGAIVPTMAVNLPTSVPAATAPPAVKVELLFGGDGTGPGLV